MTRSTPLHALSMLHAQSLRRVTALAGALLWAGAVSGAAHGMPWQEDRDPVRHEPEFSLESNTGAAQTGAEKSPLASAPRVSDGAGSGHRYRFLADRDALLSRWRGGGLAERLDLAPSFGGREIFAVQFGGPGPLPLDQRMTVFLVGGLDGRSISGGEAVLAVTEELLAKPDALPPDATFISVPWANPDGLRRWLRAGCSDGRNDRAFDDDGDGLTDEDGPDDLDEDGVVLEMLVEDPAGEWVFDEDGRFLRAAQPGEAPRYRRTREGKDEDGDGLFNEDPPGGVVLDRNFPVNWRAPWRELQSGTWPLSEPGSRALAQLAIERRTALCVFFQGNHGRLAMPGGVPPGEGVLELPLAQDLPTYRALTESFRAATGRAQQGLLALHEVQGGDRPGTAVDWCYAALGALAFEVGVWGPDVDARETQETTDAVYSRTPTVSDQGAVGGPAVTDDQAWSRWLDDTRGGLGFAPWQPCDLAGPGELGSHGSGLIGGWEPYTCINPPVELIPRAVTGFSSFVLELSLGLPRLEIELLEVGRDGPIGILRARVRNRGALPSGMGPTGDGLGARLRLELPRGVRLVAGEAEYEIGHLPAQGSSAVFDWLLMAPPDSPFRLVVESGWSPPLEKKVSL